jgi:hypothetical protein
MPKYNAYKIQGDKILIKGRCGNKFFTGAISCIDIMPVYFYTGNLTNSVRWPLFDDSYVPRKQLTVLFKIDYIIIGAGW